MIENNPLLRDIIFPSFWKDEWKNHFLSQLLLVQLEKKQIHVLYDGGGWKNRHKTMLSVLSNAATLSQMSDVKRFFIFTGDDFPVGVKTPWNLLSIVGRREDKEIIIPDPHSFSWPEIGIDDFESYRKEIMKFSNYYAKENKIVKKAYWRGSVDQHIARKHFYELVKNHNYFDVQDVVGTANFREMKHVGEFSVLVDFPGQGHSGRLKHLLFSMRPVVVFPRTAWDWVTINLEPNVHFYSTKFSHIDVANACIELIDNPEIGNFFVRNCFEKLNLIEKSTMISAISKIIQKCD